LEGRWSKLDFLEKEWLSIDGFSLAESVSVNERDRLAELLAFLRGVPFNPADEDRLIGFTFEMPKRIYKY
jgi:hypothetical protein